MLIICDERWQDPNFSHGDAAPAGTTAAENVIGSETDFLRLDSLIMVCQLNVHAVTGSKELPPLNIICEKMGIGSSTR